MGGAGKSYYSGVPETNRERDQEIARLQRERDLARETAGNDIAQLQRQGAVFNNLEKKRAEAYKIARNKDLAAGRARGEQIFKTGALGRMDTKSRAAQAKYGFTPQEQQAMREQNMKSIMQSQAAGGRDLVRNQARSGVRGALASAQAADLQKSGQGQVADQERQLFLSQIAEKRAGLDALEKLQGANITQGEKELLGRQATELGYGSLGAAERASAMQSVLGDKALLGSKEVARQSGGGKK
jgi:hypothetical protein